MFRAQLGLTTVAAPAYSNRKVLMAKSWSNRRVTEYVSPVERARNRPSSASVFAAALIALVVFFVGFMTFVTVRAEQKPATEYVQKGAQSPE